MTTVVARTLPTPSADTASDKAIRQDPYGNQGVVPYMKSGAQGAASEGASFFAANATPLTAILGHATPVVADLWTHPLLHVFHGGTAGDDKRIRLDWVELQLAVSPAGSTAEHFAAEMDVSPTRRASGGTTITPVNTNMQSGVTSGAVINFGAVVLNAATVSQRKLGGGAMREVIGVVGDRYLFDFGASKAMQSNMVLAGTTQGNITIPMPAVELGVGDQFALHIFGPSGSATPKQWYLRMAFTEKR